jgi:Tfp pilus assembly protein FimT
LIPFGAIVCYEKNEVPLGCAGLREVTMRWTHPKTMTTYRYTYSAKRYTYSSSDAHPVGRRVRVRVRRFPQTDRLRGSSGLTLAEMMTVVALGLILAAITVPTTTVLVRTHQLSTSANQLGMQLMLVRTMAISRSTDVRLVVANNGYFAEERDVTTGAWNAVGGFTSLPVAVTLTGATQQAVQFGSTGMATATELSLSDGKSTKVVAVSRLGYVKVS